MERNLGQMAVKRESLLDVNICYSGTVFLTPLFRKARLEETFLGIESCSLLFMALSSTVSFLNLPYCFVAVKFLSSLLLLQGSSKNDWL